MLLCGIVFIVVAGVFWGYCMSDELAKREHNLRAFKNFILFLQNEVTYSISPVYEAVKKYCSQKEDENKDEVAKLFVGVGVGESGQANVSELYDLLESRKKELCFLESDLSVAKDFFNNLGKSDLDGQKALFETSLIRLEENINDAKAAKEQKSKMYRALGLGAGAVIALLII